MARLYVNHSLKIVVKLTGWTLPMEALYRELSFLSLKIISLFVTCSRLKEMTMKIKILFIVIIALLAGNMIYGQKKPRKVTVSGLVVDKENQPVEGALVLVEKQNTGIITDGKGIFMIKLRPDIKMVGAYSSDKGSAEVPFEGNPEIHIVLDGTFTIRDYIPEIKADDEMVNIGYSTVKRKNLSTSVGKIDATDDRYAGYTNIYELISDRVPGVMVTGNTIRVRGITSINSGNDPLLVVDGMVVNSIDHISPREVKSISVLKGSEAAIYGSRGATGVILIDLKGAEPNK